MTNRNTHTPNNVSPRKQRVDSRMVTSKSNKSTIEKIFSEVKESLVDVAPSYVVETPKPINSRFSPLEMGTKCVRNRVNKIERTMGDVINLETLSINTNQRGLVWTGAKPKSYGKIGNTINLALTPTLWAIVERIDFDLYAEELTSTSNSLKTMVVAMMSKILTDLINGVDVSAISTSYANSIRGQHEVFEMAMRMLCRMGIVIEDSRYSFNKVNADEVHDVSCRQYRFSNELEEIVSIELKRSTRCYARVYVKTPPTKGTNGQWSNKQHKSTRANNNNSVESKGNRGHGNNENSNGSIDDAVGIRNQSINTTCYVEAPSNETMSDKEHRELIRTINGLVWVNRRISQDRQRNREIARTRANKSLIKRNRMRASKGLSPLTQ